MTSVYIDESALADNAEKSAEPIRHNYSKAFINDLLDKLLIVVDEISGVKLYGYQRPFARRLLNSFITNDGATLTALFSRQSGKSETVANVIVTAMIMLPRLAKVYPDLLGKFDRGLWVGAFAPTEGQTDIIFGRIIQRLTSDHALEFLRDPEIADALVKVPGKVPTYTLKNCGSFVSKQTAHPKANIEGRTYHVILIDECFPAGTPVLTPEGWVPIEEIVDGSRRDWNVATQGADGVEWSRVRTGFKTRRNSDLVRVDHEHGSLYATANHPFMVSGEKVPAVHLRPGTPLSLVQRTSESSDPHSEAVSAVRNSGMQQFSPGFAPQRDGERRNTEEDGGNAATNWASPYYPWGEREWVDETSADVADRVGRGVDPRVCNSVWNTREGWDTDTLQGGPGAPDADAGRGDRRGIARNAGETSVRPQEDFVVGVSRVVSVTVLEPGSAEFDQFSDGADYVYTLEVAHASHTYVTAGVVVGNCQDADEVTVNKSIAPMGASTNATTVYIGTPTYTKGVFYRQIQINKRVDTKRGTKTDHFDADWQEVAKWNNNYKLFVEKEKHRIGEDSDEFRLAYRLHWLLDKGMFTTSDILDNLGDRTMKFVSAWNKSPVVVGIDPARKQDSTIVTVVWVDWDRPDDMGFFNHRVLAWLDLENVGWEEQYFRIVEFLANFNVWKIGVDEGGLGDVVIDRLRTLMPHTEIIAVGSSRPEQSKRWKHLMQLFARQAMGWPMHAEVRRSKIYKRFRTQFEDLELHYEGPHVVAAAPKETGAHDDYCDSLAIATMMTEDYTAPVVEQSNNPFYGRRR